MADGEADGSNDAAAQTDGWQAWGGCEWMIDSEGCLTIRPKDGAEVGWLPDFDWSSPWRADAYAQSIESVKVEKRVETSSGVRGLFHGLSSAASMDLSGLDVSSVTDMSSMFSGCSSLRKISLGKAMRVDLPTPSGDGLTGRWVSSADGIAYRSADLPSGVAATYTAQHSDSVVGAANSAGGCTWKVGADGALVIAPRSDGSSGTLDCEKVDPFGSLCEAPWSQVSRDILSVYVEPGVKISGSASQLFANLPFAESMDLSGLDTSAVTEMSSMFSGCSSLASLDLSCFDTRSLADDKYRSSMSSMFSGCASLQAVDLSSFDTPSVTDMSLVFNGCESLETLDLSSFDTSKVENMSQMVQG